MVPDKPGLGFHARRGEDGLFITYPMTTVVWRAP